MENILLSPLITHASSVRVCVCVRGAAGLTLAAGAVVHELHVIDCVGRLGDKKKKQEEAFNDGAAGVVGHCQSLWKAAPERRRRALWIPEGLVLVPPLKPEQI